MSGMWKRLTPTGWTTGLPEHPHDEYLTDLEHDDKTRHDALGIDADTVDGEHAARFAFVDGSKPFTGAVQAPRFIAGRGSVTAPALAMPDGGWENPSSAGSWLNLVLAGRRLLGYFDDGASDRRFYPQGTDGSVDLGMSGLSWRNIYGVNHVADGGSATSAGFQFTGDPDTGLWSYSANRMTLVAGGTGYAQLYPDNGHLYVYKPLRMNGATTEYNGGGPHTPSFQNGWVNYGSTWANAQYHKDADGFVHLQGFVKGGAVPSTVFNLPVGYRPWDGLGHMFIAICASGGVARIDVAADGNVVIRAGIGTAQSTWTSLEGIVFWAGKEG